MPYPRKDETKEEFIKRFMGNKEAIKDYPNEEPICRGFEYVGKQK